MLQQLPATPFITKDKGILEADGKENELTQIAKPFIHKLMLRIIEEAKHRHYQKILLNILPKSLQKGNR